MPDELNEEVVEEQVEPQEEVQEEIKEEVEEKTVNLEEEKQSILDKVREKVFGKKEEVKEEKEFPEFFVKAAEKAGFKDQKELEELAGELDEDELKQLSAALLDEEEEEEGEKEEEKKEEIVEIDDDKLKPYIEKIQKALEDQYSERINTLEQHLKHVDDDRALNEDIGRQKMADDFFDGLAKELPVFGKTEELMRYPTGHSKEGQVIPFGEAFEARNSVFQMAHFFQDLGNSWKESLDEALAWYKGKHLETNVKENVIKDLNKNATRLSAKRSSANTVRKPMNEEEEKMSIIEEARRKAGIG